MKFLPAFYITFALWLSAFVTCGRGLAESLPLLSVPSGSILDQADVFQPGAVARIQASLQVAREKNVKVYILTLPSLKVVGSKQQEELERLAKLYADAWIQDEAGAIVIFDDESGLMSLEPSPEAIRRFSDVGIHFKLTGALQSLHTSGLSRDKLERAATVAAEVLVEMEIQYEKDRRRQIMVNIVMAILVLVGGALVVRSTFADDRKGTSIAPIEGEAGDKPKSISESDSSHPNG
jgi:hypothetical protein